MDTERSNIKNISTWDSGGGLVIDLVELLDGRVLGITEDAIILYDDMEDVTSGGPTKKRQTIFL